jgi:hypothetical protein
MLVNCCLQFPVLSNQLNAVPILSNQLNARVPNRHRTSRFQTDTRKDPGAENPGVRLGSPANFGNDASSSLSPGHEYHTRSLQHRVLRQSNDFTILCKDD